MKLNVDKCKLMCSGRQNPTPSSTLLHLKLTGTTQGKDPGVIVNSSMKTSVSSTAAGSKANTTRPVQGTFQIVTGVTVMWRGTGTARQLPWEQGEQRQPGTSHPEQHPWIEDILPSGSLEYQGRGVQSSSCLWGVGFLGRVVDKPPQHYTQHSKLCTWPKALDFCGRIPIYWLKVPENPGVALQLMCLWLGLPSVAEEGV